MTRLAAWCRRAHVALVVALGLRLVWLYVLYARGDPSVLHHHIESHAFLFVAAGAALRLYTSTPDDRGVTGVRPSLWMLAAFLGVALVLYWRALGVGFLSDDFVLADRAAAWKIGPVSTGLFRPLPLALWALALSVGGGPVVLHLLNIALHALAAYLTVWVARGWMRNTRWSTAAGLVFLTSPVAVEAVTWCSGVFDTSATVLVLALVLWARRLSRDAGGASETVTFWIFGMAALLSKETAAVAPVLIGIDAFARGSASRRLIRQTTLLLLVAGAFSVVRLTYAFGVQAPPLSRYVVQRAVFSTFDMLAAPWHGDIVAAHPSLAVASVAILVALLLVGFAANRGAGLRTAAATTAWICVAILPVLPVVFLSPDNQGTRYFYLPLVGWAGLVASVGAAQLRSRLAWIPAAAVAAMVGLGAYGVPAHVSFWQQAADSRDVVERAVRLDGRIAKCETVALRGLPDSVHGAYVFRNGWPEAFRRDLGIRVAAAADVACTFDWDDEHRSFLPASETIRERSLSVAGAGSTATSATRR